ncbi:hypothetical protein JCM8208_006133 [Rhodotorula glutinis]
MEHAPDQSEQAQHAFPDLSELASSFNSASSSSAPRPPPTTDDNDPASIWATVPSPTSSTAPGGTSASGYHATYLTPAPAPPPHDLLADLDPLYQGTLGSTVRRGSKLEVLDNSESESGSPTDDRRLADDQRRSAAQLGTGQPPPAASGGGFSFGNVLRSISGTPARDRAATSTPPPPQPRAASTSAASATRPHRPSTPPSAAPPSAPQTPSGPSGLAKPLASIASVFRSTGRTSASSSSTSTPQPGSSPQREKGSFMTAIVGAGSAKGKDKERALQPESEQEKGGELDEKGGGKGKERAQLPEPVFDFNKFLEQMRSRTADPIAKYLRSFLKEFSRRPPVSTSDQVRVINDFLDFIAGKMRTVDPWKSLLDVDWRDDPERAEAEFDLTLEAMEKLVMNRLWHLTFTPALDLSAFPSNMSPSGDVERDEILKQRMRLFSWIEPKHLDLPIPSPSSISSEPASSAPPAVAQPSSSSSSTEPAEEREAAPAEASKAEESPQAHEPVVKERKPKGDKVQGFLDFAQRELRKMNQYKAPRDKLICVLNCCKVIFGLIRHVSNGDQGADAFIPFLIYVVIRANPEHLVSNLQYIQRFRNPEKLSGEGGYYLSSLNAAISFIESLDASSLSNITQDEFESNVAVAVKQVASEEPPPPPPPRDAAPSSRPSTPSTAPRPPASASGPSADLIQPSEAASASLLAPAGEGGVAPATPSAQDLSFPESMKASLLRGTDSVERAMSKPLGALARVFEQLEQTANELTGQGHAAPPQVPPAPFPPLPGAARPGVSKRRSYYGGGGAGGGAGPGGPRRPELPALPPSSGSLRAGQVDDEGAEGQGPDLRMYAPEEETDEAVLREIDRQHEEARLAALETLQGIFPDVENEVLEMVLLSNSGDMGKTIDSLLEMTAT